MRRSLLFRGGLIGVAAAVAGFAFGAAIGDGGAALWAGVVIATVAGLGLGLVAFYRPAASVTSVTGAALDLAGGALDRRARTASSATVDLVHNFNSMAARVQELFATMSAEHARLEAVFEAATDAMIAVAADTTVRFLNAASLEVLGITRESATGRPFIESARDYELDALVRRAGATRSPESAVITYGRLRAPLRAVAVPIQGGGDWAVLLVLNDLTEVHRTDQVRRDFLSNVSHELRTPLAAIRALVETLEDDDIGAGAEAAEFLSRIRQQVERLTALVNELLDLSRIEAGAIDLQPEEVSLSVIVAEAASLLRTRTERDGISIAAPVDGASVEADRPSVLRVVSNLLDNAIKYSPPRSTIHVETRDEGGLVALSVRDEGPGIAAKDLPRVFERFYKGDSSRADSGVGLGLAIVKHLVRSHGGTVDAANSAEGGAQFTVRLPRHFVGNRR